MKKDKLTKAMAGATLSVLNHVLKVDANSTSCMYIYQPKAPKDLERFRKIK